MPSSKRKRSGPGTSHRDDPDSSRSNRQRFEQRNKRQVYRVSSKLISGPGILVSCVQGRERKAALQFMDLLNETADRIYPGVIPQPFPQNETDTSKKSASDAEEDEMDALRNGPAPTTQPQNPASEVAVRPDDDIEAQITAELSHIKDSERRRGPRSGPGGDRFRKVETDTECLVFISVSRPLDPCKLVVALLDQVAETGEPGTRFVQRLSPIQSTCHADYNSLLQHASHVLPHYFPPHGPGRTFKIDPRIRSHSTLRRNDVIQAIAESIPNQSDTDKLHTANLTNPDFWIVVEILKNVAAISVVDHFDRYKKYNLQSVADAANQNKAEMHENRHGISNEAVQTAHPEGRIANSLVKPASVPETTIDDPRPARHSTSPEAQQQPPSTSQPEKDSEPDNPMAGFKLF